MFLNFAGGNRDGVRRRTTLTIGPFIKQARELAKMESTSALDGFTSLMLTLNQTHPFPAWRLMHLLQWAEKTPGDSRLPLGFGYLTAPIEGLFPAARRQVGPAE